MTRTRRIRVAASPARVAAQTGPIPAGQHLADRMPMRWTEERRSRRGPVVAGIAGAVPLGLLAWAALSGVLGG